MADATVPGPMIETEDFADHVFQRAARHRGLTPSVLSILLRAMELLALALGTRIASLRDSDDALAQAVARIATQEHLLEMERQSNAILVGRWEKIPPRNRPHYTPEQRYKILCVMARTPLTVEQTALRFGVSVSAICSWRAEAAFDPLTEDEGTVGSLVKPIPPMVRIGDGVRELIQSMALHRFGGSGQIARTLWRAGERVSRRTVQRVRKEKILTPPPQTGHEGGMVVTAKAPRHVTLLDITDLPLPFGLAPFKLAVVLDVFSRFPLAFQVYVQEPTAAAIKALFARAVASHGPIGHLVTDQGPQLTAAEFRRAVEEQGTRQRFGAIGQYGSIAIIERFWKTLKELLALPSGPEITIRDWTRRVELALEYYAHHRPHSSLGGATPFEVFSGQPQAHLEARSPPRGRPGEATEPSPIRIRKFHPELPLPILVRAA